MCDHLESREKQLLARGMEIHLGSGTHPEYRATISWNPPGPSHKRQGKGHED
jgi:hypothetical protein